MNTDFLTTRQRQLYSWLVEIANIGEPAPAVPAMRRRIGASQDNYALTALNALEECGLIKIEGDGKARVITIVETGKSTKRLEAKPEQTPTERPTPPVRRASAKGDPMERILAIGRAVDRQRAQSTVATTPPAPPAPPLQPPTAVKPPAARAPAEQPTRAPLPSPSPSKEIEVSEQNSTPADIAAAPSLAGLNADVSFHDGELRLTIWLSTDAGPAKRFRPFLTVPLDEIGATELLGTTAIALRDARQALAS